VPDRNPGPLTRFFERFTELGEVERRAIKAVPLRMVFLAAGAQIQEVGARPMSCTLVLRGILVSHKTSLQGQRQIIGLSIAGDVPDLVGLLARLDVSVVAAGKAQVAYIAHADLKQLMADHPRLAITLSRSAVSTRLIEREWLYRNGQLRSESRLAHFFCEAFYRAETRNVCDVDGLCCLPLTQGDIAEALGLSKVHVNRAVQALRLRGLVSFEKGRLYIRDWARLAALGCFDSAYLEAEGKETPKPVALADEQQAPAEA
jgi:CRP-like cAMP-binding protein